MTLPLTKRGRDVFAGYDAAGNARRPDNGDAVVWSTEMERSVEAAVAGLVEYVTWSQLSATEGTRSGQPAHVLGPDTGTHTDPVVGSTVANTGSFSWSAAPAGWRRTGGLPAAIVHATNSGAGTANAIVATADATFDQAPYQTLVSVNFVAANDGPMTLSVNGEAARDLVTNTGAVVPGGYIQSGMHALVQIDENGDYRLFSYGDAAAVQAAAEASLAAAQLLILGAYADDAAATAAAGTPTEGLLYWNTTTPELRVYDGANWVSATQTAATRIVYTATADGSTTVYSDLDSSANSGNSFVFIDGRQTQTGFTLVAGTLTLDEAPAVGVPITVITFQTMPLSNTIAAQVGLTDAEGNFEGDTVEEALTELAHLRRGKFGNSFKVGDYSDDLTAAVAACHSAGGGTVELPRGSLVFSTGFAIPGDVELVGQGRDVSRIAITAASSGDLASTYGLYAQGTGSFTTLPSFTSIGIGEFIITFGAAHGLAVGDVVNITDQSDWSFAGYRQYYWKGWLARVVAVESSTKVYMSHPSPANLTYNASTCIARKVPARRGKLGGFTIDMSGTVVSVSGGLHLEYGDGVVLDDFGQEGGRYTGIYLRQCFDMRPTRLKSTTQERSTFSGNDYAIIVGNSSCITIEGTFSANWHATSIGGGSDTGAAHNYRVKFRDCNIRNSYTPMASDMHGNSEETVYENCNIDGGVGLAGKNGRYQNCKINLLRGQNNVLAYANELVGGTFGLIDCEMVTSKDSGAFGALSFGASGSADSYATEEIFYHVHGGSLRVNNASEDYAAFVYNNTAPADAQTIHPEGAPIAGYGPHPSSVLIDLPITHSNPLAETLRCRNIGSPGAAKYCVVKQRSPLPSGGVTLVGGYSATFTDIPS